MVETVPLPLAEWESFYVIIGSSAAALTGLMFVVIALGADAKLLAGEAELGTFATPTVVHFCAVLFISAVLSAPWHSAGYVAVGLGICGAVGLAYVLVTMRRARGELNYKPVFEDWIWHVLLPFLAYLLLLIAAVIFAHHLDTALFLVAATALLLLYVGIHNAWDAATWMASAQHRNPKEDSPHSS